MRNLATTLLSLCLCGAAHADEGMWTFDDFPTEQMQAAYGWAPDPSWLRTVQLATLRLNSGCSASFVSADGLVMTNNHCARDCVAALSDTKHDYIAKGFYAKTVNGEKPCVGFEADELVAIKDVTGSITALTKGKSGKAFADAERAAISQTDAQCETGTSLLCEVVPLYHGGIYDLYTYRRYQDLRLVLAVEDDAANFGGDPDNFEFPRYDIDVTLLRVYDHGEPFHPSAYFKFASTPPKSGDVVVTAGSPQSTHRDDTVAQLLFRRDYVVPTRRAFLSEEAGILWDMGETSPELARECRNDYFFTMNNLKAFEGEQEALRDGPLMVQKLAAETVLRKKMAANPSLAPDLAAFDKIAQAQTVYGKIFMRLELLDEFPQWTLPDVVRQTFELNRYAAESAKPDAQRLEDYNAANLPGIQQDIEGDGEYYPIVEKRLIAWWLMDMRFYLGADDPDVQAILGRQSPDEIAELIIDGTKLTDTSQRTRLFVGGAKAINASQDPLLVFIRRLDRPARKVLDDYNDNVDAVVTQNTALISRAKFALYGTGIYPDGTLTPRLSYGQVKGYEQDGNFVPPFTSFTGAFARATGEEPFKLPPSWIKAAPQIDMSTHLDIALSVDITGGDSGSPVLNRAGEITGLMFDVNIQSLGGDFGYDGTANRGIAVDATALKLALTSIYHAERLAKEISKE
jgi:hypothetical protein